MLLGVIADTHIPAAAPRIPDDVLAAFEGVDLILHAGDLVSPAVIEELASVAPVEAVAGNMDSPEVRRLLPAEKIVRAGGHRIGLVHGAGPVASIVERVRGTFDGVSVIVFGHSHTPLVRELEGVLLMNPGSPTDRHFAAARTVGRLHFGSQVRGEILYL